MIAEEKQYTRLAYLEKRSQVSVKSVANKWLTNRQGSTTKKDIHTLPTDTF